MSLIVVNSPNKLVERKSSKKQVGQIIVGFEEEKNLIISQLTNRLAELDVISIIEMPGAGKTTLAYKVFNDKSVTSHFDICAWCTVDQEYDSKKVLHKIFNQVIGLDAEFMEDFDVYDELRKKLHSRSREKKVALHGKRHSDPLNLRLLRQEESWELLEKKVFGEESCPDELKDVGEEIALKCEGLPLALDMIGGVIAKMEVLNNLKSFKNEGEVMEVIELSYYHLLDHLKPCLLYLASYPKDEDIRISQLNALWSAEGFVEQNAMKSVEEVSESYVYELISSSLVILFNERGIRDPSIKIHDLVHDFCLRKAEKEKLFGFVVGMYDKLPENYHLRHLRLLKRLELPYITLTDSLLNEIGMLVYLRCLIIQIKARAFPPSFANLLNLETLVVHNVSSTTVGEESFPVLEELQLLYCSEIKEIPDSFGDITSLKSIALESNSQLEDSALRIKEYISEMTGEDKLELKESLAKIDLFPYK
uniref:Late blight resistance protein homolog R1B-16 n=1 Tax=Nicotiana tabacum TaxID=4097 RepID=A0A1S3ZKX7_TOBAC|nr:PREDICTED: putative late blight resistance protein homolog R1B-16 [Nicotiana tabacum]